jgi:hypothetical protein
VRISPPVKIAHFKRVFPKSKQRVVGMTIFYSGV